LPSHLEASKGGVFIREENRKPSPRQQRVIALVARGLKNREIAQKLGIGEHVVRNYLGIIFDKVGVNNRVELALWYEARVHERRSREKK
jgi:DNA-binding CsgD family transcriptional regulator